VKKDVEKDIKVNSTPARKVSARQVLRDKIDETYLQINQLSFQQNFKALIGHYKSTVTSLTL